ncbi:hypothetical protein PanWU01x14_202160 [Parasponia andersonii]|uniref:Uncharacterized protein n=1 Tax=Parasponia andersonii TaxID=3476 RepID=A0A2P5BXI6_PARAD|nr:hypothetical protein PanWU01x14_202160 [Parasponia andersonii]
MVLCYFLASDHSGCAFGVISSMLTIVSPIKDYGFLIYGYNATPRKPVWERRDFEIESFDRRGINTKDCYFPEQVLSVAHETIIYGAKDSQLYCCHLKDRLHHHICSV